MYFYDGKTGNTIEPFSAEKAYDFFIISKFSLQ